MYKGKKLLWKSVRCEVNARTIICISEMTLKREFREDTSKLMLYLHSKTKNGIVN